MAPVWSLHSQRAGAKNRFGRRESPLGVFWDVSVANHADSPNQVTRSIGTGTSVFLQFLTGRKSTAKIGLQMVGNDCPEMRRVSDCPSNLLTCRIANKDPHQEAARGRCGW